MECGIEKPSHKPPALDELDPGAWAGEVKCIRGERPRRTAAGLYALRAAHTRSIEPARNLP